MTIEARSGLIGPHEGSSCADLNQADLHDANSDLVKITSLKSFACLGKSAPLRIAKCPMEDLSHTCSRSCLGGAKVTVPRRSHGFLSESMGIVVDTDLADSYLGQHCLHVIQDRLAMRFQ